MNVTLYTFSKRARSTKRPTGGQTFACTVKAPFNVLAPSVVLALQGGATANPYAWNYAYISDFNRYYYINEWTNNGQTWTATLTVDALASWKTQIGANSIYVYRSSVSYNNKIADSLYPQKSQAQSLTVNLPKVWTVGGANAAPIPAAANSYTIVAGIIGTKGTVFYAFTPANWARFYENLFSNQFYTDVLGEFGATEYPEAKVAISPMQYISSVMAVPLGIAQFPNNNEAYSIPHSGPVSQIPVGNVPVPHTPGTGDDITIAWKIPETAPYSWTYSLEIGSDFFHPQADERGDWLNFAPATSYELFWPPLGSIPLEPSTIAEAEYLDFTIRVDWRSGVGMLDIEARYTINNATRRFPLYRSEFSTGVPIQVSNVLTPGLSSSQQSYYDAGSALYTATNSFLNVGTAIQAFGKVPTVGGMVASGIQTAIHNMTPQVTTSGKFASTSTMGGQPRLIVTHWLYADDDLDGQGRPLCQIRLISDIPGYIRGYADEVAVPCYASELGEIRAAIAGGFYYE